MDVIGYWRYSRGYVGGFLSGLRQFEPPPISIHKGPDSEDPEILLAQAQQEMKENQAKNRERAVQAITQKNNLQAEVDKTQKMVNNLQAKAEMAKRAGDEQLEAQLLTEKQAYQDILANMKSSLAFAVVTIETIKTAIRREEERIRAKTAQAMALKTQWKQSQIEAAIELSIEAESDALLKPLRAEIRALVAQANRLSDELWVQAERALRNGNRALARAILQERVTFAEAFSNPT